MPCDRLVSFCGEGCLFRLAQFVVQSRVYHWCIVMAFLRRSRGSDHSRTGRMEKGMAFELRHLRYVIAAAEQHSFRRVASVMGVHQSAISRLIRDLEDELGASLFNRHSCGVELTFAGQSFLDHAKRAVGQIECAARLVDAQPSPFRPRSRRSRLCRLRHRRQVADHRR